MTINIDDIVKQATSGQDTSSAQTVRVASGASAKTKSSSGQFVLTNNPQAITKYLYYVILLYSIFMVL